MQLFKVIFASYTCLNLGLSAPTSEKENVKAIEGNSRDQSNLQTNLTNTSLFPNETFTDVSRQANAKESDQNSNNFNPWEALQNFFRQNTTSNSGHENNNLNPLQAIQNFFSNNQNGQNNNPLQSLFGNNNNNGQTNPLSDVKLFMVGTQGVVMPASVLTNGALNFLTGLGNLGNIAQNIGGNLFSGGRN